MNSEIVPGSFVAISDFHSYSYPVDKVVDHYLDEYETIYILGDATDRGPKRQGQGGIEILSRIKDLCEETNGRVVYIPGNHDLFLYDFGMYEDNWALRNMGYNGGIKTVQEFADFEKKEPQKAYELIEWLGNLPLQRKHRFDNKDFALAHAFFNEKLYEKFPDFTLADLYLQKYEKTRDAYNYLASIVWFRKAKDSYYRDDVPSADTTVVIGHTPERLRQGENLDLENGDGKTVKVHCVDGGITYRDNMLKYDGGSKIYETKVYTHHDTSPKKSHWTRLFPKKEDETVSINMDEALKKEGLFRGVILDVVKESPSLASAQNILGKYCTSGDERWLPGDGELKRRAAQLSEKDLSTILFMYGSQFGRGDNLSLGSLCSDYVNETIVDHALLSLEERYESKSRAVRQLAGAIKERDLAYITDTVGSARTIAAKLGIDGITNVMLKRGCRSVKDYATAKFGKEYSL